MIVVIDGRYIQDHFPGIGRYTYNLIGALAGTAPHDTFVVLHNPALRNTRYDVAALARYPNIILQRVDVPTLSLAEQYLLSSTIHRRPAAILHSPYFVKPYFLRVPSIVTIFDLIPLRYPKDLPNARARLFFRLAVSLAAHTAVRIIAPSLTTRDDLMTLLHMPREKIVVAPLAADARFAPQPDAEISRVREKYALPARYVLSVGINKPHKNMVTLIDVWRHIESDIALVIAGAWDERYAGDASTILHQGNRGAREIRFIHNISESDLPALYAGATVFVMPSLYEGFGLPPLEAMACGAPVICSNAASLPEVVGDAALLVNPREADEIARTIARILSNAALREELHTRSLARAAQFSWEHTARETLEVYRAI